MITAGQLDLVWAFLAALLALVCFAKLQAIEGPDLDEQQHADSVADPGTSGLERKAAREAAVDPGAAKDAAAPAAQGPGSAPAPPPPQQQQQQQRHRVFWRPTPTQTTCTSSTA